MTAKRMTTRGPYEPRQPLVGFFLARNLLSRRKKKKKKEEEGSNSTRKVLTTRQPVSRRQALFA